MTMQTKTISDRLARLKDNPESIDWTDRVDLVGQLLDGATRARPLGPEARALLGCLAVDPKWEVRKAVATSLYRLHENDFAGLAAKLTHDDNAYVKTAAERAMSQRRKGHSTASKRARGLDRNERELKTLERKHGIEASAMVRDMAQRMYEGLVGASVHEMRSVITAMKTNIENLQRAGASESHEASQKLCPRLFRSVAFLERLLDDMRAYTQASPRKRGTERVIDLVVEAGEMVQAEFQATKRDYAPVVIEGKVPDGIVCRVARDRMILALRNLIKNAYDAFMIDEASFSPGIIRIEATEEETGVIITIRDNGMGLSEEELEEVRQFVPGKSSKLNLGTGFGLPIARKTIRDHGGDLRIDSREEEGTEVHVWLPAGNKRDS